MQQTHYTGSCLCGEIQFAVSELDREMAHCHCTMCRKFHGAAFSTFASAKDFRWLAGEDFLASYIGNNGSQRQFCRQCGSSLTFRAAGAEHFEFALAALDTPISEHPDAHVWVDNRANWHNITDDLPQFSGGRGCECRHQQETP
ncbi:GFA family protein [Deefgea rivuli]|uniref:GFA family protein n=1 Tax=Deefgea rivuli TaxID=400948 RepID=UPI000684C654|nr:GFA family protein [Deefgea rivuli]